MPVALAMPGFALTKQQRIIAVIEGVGGPVKAAAVANVSRTTIRNWRQENADPPIGGFLPLCVEAGVSLDWVETGYQVRPDLAARSGELQEAGAGALRSMDGLLRLAPLQPDVPANGSGGAVAVERWAPSEIAFSEDWLRRRLGLTADFARYTHAGDHGMMPVVEKGALLIVDTRPANIRPGLCTVKVGDELVARRLHRLPDGRAELVADAEPAWRFTLPANAGANDNLLLHPIVWVAQPG